MAEGHVDISVVATQVYLGRLRSLGPRIEHVLALLRYQSPEIPVSDKVLWTASDTARSCLNKGGAT